MRIQKGSQKVNDQMFKAFAFPERDFETNTDEGVNYMSQNIIMSRNLPDGSAKFRIMATFGSFATIIGFIVQFVGLRVIATTHIPSMYPCWNSKGNALVSYSRSVRLGT